MSIYKSMRKRLVAAGTAAVIMASVAANGASAEMRFTDVVNQYTEPVTYLSSKGIVNGKSETLYGTNQNIMRGETAVIIARALGLDTKNAPDGGFTDVGHYGPYVNAILEEGIISKATDNKYNPGLTLTRGAMAKILVEAYDVPLTEKKSPFTDAVGVFGSYIDALHTAGIANGKTDVEFGTNMDITRGDFAVLLYKTIQKYGDPTGMDLTFGGIPDNGIATEPIIIVKVEATADATVSVKHNGTAVKESGVGGYVLNLSEGENKIVATAVDAAGNKVSKEATITYNSACDYDPASTENPDRQTINCLITEVVRENGNKVPPEIVKAVAEKESAWTQFVDGKPLIRTEKDGREGIGIMQITNTAGYEEEKLKYDIKYNIKAGVDFLVKNFYSNPDLPKINDHDPTDLESWYFAIMAYNGIVPANSPVKQETGERNAGAYQELVYDKLESGNANEVITNIDDLDMKPEDFEYDRNSSDPIKFIKKSFELEESLLTPSSQLFKVGDIVFYEGSGLRPRPEALGSIISTTPTDELKIIGNPVKDSRPAIVNHYLWYPVMKVSTGEIGYIASHLIKK